MSKITDDQKKLADMIEGGIVLKKLNGDKEKEVVCPITLAFASLCGGIKEAFDLFRAIPNLLGDETIEAAFLLVSDKLLATIRAKHLEGLSVEDMLQQLGAGSFVEAT